MTDKPSKQHRLPVRLVNGQFELEYGGAVPLHDGARCELVVSESQISDPHLLRHLQEKKAVKILDSGTKLVAMLARPLSEAVPSNLEKHLLPSDFQYRHLGKWFTRWSPNTELRNFVEIEIGQANPSQLNMLDTSGGGLWLVVQGGRAAKLVSSPIHLPDIDLPETIPPLPAQSLNHALTLLSEAFEPWRISHTGNVYEQILYQETNGKWYPLLFLREQQTLEEGQMIADAHWKRFMSSMKPKS